MCASITIWCLLVSRSVNAIANAPHKEAASMKRIRCYVSILYIRWVSTWHAHNPPVCIIIIIMRHWGEWKAAPNKHHRRSMVVEVFQLNRLAVGLRSHLEMIWGARQLTHTMLTWSSYTAYTISVRNVAKKNDQCAIHYLYLQIRSTQVLVVLTALYVHRFFIFGQEAVRLLSVVRRPQAKHVLYQDYRVILRSPHETMNDEAWNRAHRNRCYSRNDVCSMLIWKELELD